MPADAQAGHHSERRFRVFAVLEDGEALGRLERIFALAPDRELVGVTGSAGEAYERIVAANVRSVYVDADLRGTRRLIVRLRRTWHGFVRAFATASDRRARGGAPVVPFAELAGVLEGIYEPRLESGLPGISLDFQNLILDSIYQRGPDEGFIIVGYDGDVVFYGPRAARAGGLPYPPPPGLTEADVSHLVGRAHRREQVASDHGIVLAERFWVRASRD